MLFKRIKATRWTKKRIRKNLSAAAPVNCEAYVHEADKKALAALKKIPLLDKLCNKILSVINDAQRNLIDMSELCIFDRE